MVLVVVFVFLVTVVVFLLNMLVAQLTCAYEAVYVDMVGYALERANQGQMLLHGFYNMFLAKQKTRYRLQLKGVVFIAFVWHVY